MKQGGLTAHLVTERNHVAQLALAGDRIGVVTTSGLAYVKQGGLHRVFRHETTGSLSARQLALSSTRVGIVTGTRSVPVKSGSLSAAWSVQKTAAARSVTPSGGRIGVLQTDGAALVTSGSHGTGFVRIYSGRAASLVLPTA